MVLYNNFNLKSLYLSTGKCAPGTRPGTGPARGTALGTGPRARAGRPKVRLG